MADRVTVDPLDQLATAAAEFDQPALGAAPGEAVSADAPTVTNAQAFAGALAAGREAFCFFTKLESPRRVLSDDRVGQLAGLADPVLSKHGIELGRYLGDYGAEIALAVAAFGVVAELRSAVAAEVAAKDKAAQDSAPVSMVEPVTSGE